jgi:hypothetical protein
MDAAEYRAKARELREKATTTHDQEVCGNLLTIADQYVLLAKYAEDDDRKPKKGGAKEKPRRVRGEWASSGQARASQCAPQRNKKSPAGEGGRETETRVTAPSKGR